MIKKQFSIKEKHKQVFQNISEIQSTKYLWFQTQVFQINMLSKLDYWLGWCLYK